MSSPVRGERTNRTKVHEAGEGDDPEFLGIDNIATIKLGKPTLDVWANERGIGRGTDQKTIGQPIVQGERNTGNNTEHTGGSEYLVCKRSRRRPALDTREIAVIDVGNGLRAEVRRGSHSHNQERDHGVRYESPLDTLPLVVDRVK